MSTDPSVDSPVVAGQTISVTAAWSTSDWAGSTLDKVDACVRIAGADRNDLGYEEKPASNDGSFQHSFVVPADAPVGADVVCVRVGVHGQPSGANPSTQKSARVCWDVVTAASGGNTTTQGGGNTTTQGGGNTTTQGGGNTTTQVEGATVTQNGGTNSTDVAAGNATPTNGTGGATSEVFGISLDAGNTTGSGTLAANKAQTTQGGAQATSGSALPATSGAINPQALASTGSATQALVLMAGLALLLGGLAVSFSSPRRAIA